VVAGGEVGLERGRDPQVGVPQPVHGRHKLDLCLVDLHHAAVGGDAEDSTTGSSTSARVVVWGPKPVALASSATQYWVTVLGLVVYGVIVLLIVAHP
jgi:hypothetical protein